ncbi:MAG: flagellar hook-basal body complex protein, partial [Desulfovermiculus sp.]
MGVDTALYSGVSGLNANSNAMNVIGNNLSNSQTTGFKAERSLFSDMLASEVASASGSSQIGRGVGLSTVDREFSQGSFKDTGINTDMGIDGDGFFMVSDPDQEGTKYTRDGSFRFNDQGVLVNSLGYKVQGYNIDDDGNQGQIGDIQADMDGSIAPKATSEATFDTNLNQDADIINGSVQNTTYEYNAIDVQFDGLENAENGDTIEIELEDGKTVIGNFDGTKWDFGDGDIDADASGSTVSLKNDDPYRSVEKAEASIDSNYVAGIADYGDIDEATLDFGNLENPQENDRIEIELTDGKTAIGIYNGTDWDFSGDFTSLEVDGNEVILEEPPAEVQNATKSFHVFDLANPNETSNFSASINAYDCEGAAHQVSVFYTKTGVNEWAYNVAVPASEVGAGGASNETSFVGLARGTLEFDDTGKLTKLINPEGAQTDVYDDNGNIIPGSTTIETDPIAWSNGADTAPMNITLGNIDTENNMAGLTQYASE